MRVIQAIAEMQRQSDEWRRRGLRVVLVPTMGYLHEGHLSLMRLGRRAGDRLVASIFVNPAQFAPGEDYEKYPRDPERDLRLCEETGVDAAFLPSAEEMYPPGYQTYVDVSEVSRPLCGASRPVFFRGVATVVCKLFHMVKPHAAVFGEKDYQQLLTVRRMVRDLDLDVEVLGHPLVREEDGLAMSSRNVYLSAERRAKALRLSQALDRAEALVKGGERRAGAVLEEVARVLGPDDEMRVDYAEIRDTENLETVHRLEGPVLLALAAFVGDVRLIDNRVLTPSPSTA